MQGIIIGGTGLGADLPDAKHFITHVKRKTGIRGTSGVIAGVRK